jgi:uncharacterized protein
MANPRKPFRLNVGFIVHEEIGYSHHFPFDFGSVTLGDDLELGDLKGEVTIDRTQQGLVVRGRFSARTKLECVRCLKEFSQPLQWEYTELFAFTKKTTSETELVMPDDGHIDLEPILREYALLEVPIKALCRPKCKGLCIECGQDLNVKDCGHSQGEDESPFSVLKGLL